MKFYPNPLAETIESDELLFSIPPFKVEQVFVSSSETIDWGLKLLNVPDFWKFTQGEGITIAVLDTGVAANHPDLAGAILDSKDFTDSPTGTADTNGHGTHCIGIIAARKNSSGIVGVAPKAKILSGKVLNDEGYGSAEMIAKGIDWAVKKGADIISMSLGSPAPFKEIYDAIQRAIAKGVFVICAAGNSGPNLNSINFPGKFEDVITVGSIDRRMDLAYYSSRGKELDIVAPGDNILSTYPPYGFALLSGTSMATPFVAGIAALVLSKHRKYAGQTPITTQKELEEHLRKTAIDLGALGPDVHFGFGLINPDRLLGNK